MAMEGINTVDAEMSVLLHPSRAGSVLLGVQEILNSLLLRFSEQFEGVILAYLAPKIITSNAKILSGLTPYFHVSLVVKLIIFSPAPGMKIEGKVIKIEKDYIGLLVLGLFNTTIGLTDIREDLDYGASKGGVKVWASRSDYRHKIDVGSLIRFSVKSLQAAENFIDICGSLEETDTGCVKWLERAFAISRSEPGEPVLGRPSEGERKKRRKRKKDESGQELLGERRKMELIPSVGNSDVDKISLLSLTEPRRSKKRRQHGAQL